MEYTICVAGGLLAIVDREDWGRLVCHRWCSNHGYVRRSVKGKWVYLHQEVAGTQATREVDHRNRNKLDNRKENLRPCTHGQNTHNIGLTSRNTTGYKGVSFDRNRQKFAACIATGGQNRRLGHYNTAEEAARAYDAAAQERHGEFAWLNFPIEIGARL